MNFGSPLPRGQHGASLQPEWSQLGAWRDALAQCARKPSRKRVHLLRSLTLRVRTALEFRLLEQAPQPAAARSFDRWKKEGRKLRRVLEPVRDADAYLARLGGLPKSVTGSIGGEPQPSPRCLREMVKLEDRLGRQRMKGNEKIIAAMNDRGNRLNRLSLEMEAALVPRMPSNPGLAAQEALRILTGLAGELPTLDSANLHDWRKRLKQALYLAEISSASSPAARRLAASIKKMHSAVGEWHDWQALALLAARVLPGHGKPDGVVPVLNKLAEEALTKALALCRQSTPRLLSSAGESWPSQRRKPVASVPVSAQFANGTNLRVSSL
jgi:hypothetical protein